MVHAQQQEVETFGQTEAEDSGFVVDADLLHQVKWEFAALHGWDGSLGLAPAPGKPTGRTATGYPPGGPLKWHTYLHVEENASLEAESNAFTSSGSRARSVRDGCRCAADFVAHARGCADHMWLWKPWIGDAMFGELLVNFSETITSGNIKSVEKVTI